MHFACKAPKGQRLEYLQQCQAQPKGFPLMTCLLRRSNTAGDNAINLCGQGSCRKGWSLPEAHHDKDGAIVDDGGAGD